MRREEHATCLPSVLVSVTNAIGGRSQEGIWVEGGLHLGETSSSFPNLRAMWWDRLPGRSSVWRRCAGTHAEHDGREGGQPSMQP